MLSNKIKNKKNIIESTCQIRILDHETEITYKKQKKNRKSNFQQI